MKVQSQQKSTECESVSSSLQRELGSFTDEANYEREESAVPPASNDSVRSNKQDLMLSFTGKQFPDLPHEYLGISVWERPSGTDFHLLETTKLSKNDRLVNESPSYLDFCEGLPRGIHDTGINTDHIPAPGQPLSRPNTALEAVPALTADGSSRYEESCGYDAVSFEGHEQKMTLEGLSQPISKPPIVPVGNDSEDSGIEESIESESYQLSQARRSGSEWILDESDAEKESDRGSDSMDLFWFSDYSEPTPTKDEGYPLLGLYRHSAVELLLSAFRTYQQTRTPNSHHENGNTMPTAGVPSSGPQQRGKFPSGLKRGRSSDWTKDSSQGSQSIQKSIRPFKCKKKRHVMLACPFSKKDPQQYKSCYRHRLTKISYVKQHLSRNHRLPIYCPICMAIFDTEEERDVHTRAISYEVQAICYWEGVSEAQKKQLQRKVPTGMSEEDQWYTIFEILFPSIPRPKSPYVDSELSEDLLAYQDFMTNQGPAILRDHLRENGVDLDQRDLEADLPNFLNTVLADGFQAIFEQYFNSMPSLSSTLRGDRSGTLEPSENLTSSQDGRTSSTILAEDRVPPDSRREAAANIPLVNGLEDPACEPLRRVEDQSEHADGQDNANDGSRPGQYSQSLQQLPLFQCQPSEVFGDDIFNEFVEHSS